MFFRDLHRLSDQTQTKMNNFNSRLVLGMLLVSINFYFVMSAQNSARSGGRIGTHWNRIGKRMNFGASSSSSTTDNKFESNELTADENTAIAGSSAESDSLTQSVISQQRHLAKLALADLLLRDAIMDFDNGRLLIRFFIFFLFYFRSFLLAPLLSLFLFLCWFL